VREGSSHRKFADLHGSIFAFNDKNSLSGYYCMRFHLHKFLKASNGTSPNPFFSTALETGGHSRSLEALLDGRADVTVVDMNVLRKLRSSRLWRARLKLLRRLDDVHELGPYPGQPFVAPTNISSELREELRQALLSAGPRELVTVGWKKIVQVGPETYEEVRRLLGECRGVDLVCDKAGYEIATPIEPSQIGKRGTVGERGTERGGRSQRGGEKKRLRC
jgi:ABC-type phosphate/phosphonate transport system substrate-binding protein